MIHSEVPLPDRRSSGEIHARFAKVAGCAGWVVHSLSVYSLQPFQWNVISYRTEPGTDQRLWSAAGFAVLLVLAPLAAATRIRRNSPTNSGPAGNRWASLLPLWFAAPALICSVASALDVISTPPFWTAYVVLLGSGWSVFRSICQWSPRESSGRAKSCGAVVAVAIATFVIVHFELQVVFFEHFMLGHSDIGHYAEELKNCLAGRGLRSDSFPNSRFGWHFVPLMYALVPLYALWPSVKLLMVLAGAVLALSASVMYAFIRRTTGSALIASLCALAWLLLPSTSRMVYSNTYGFQWVYAAVPLLMALLFTTKNGKAASIIALAAAVLLVQETLGPAVFGVGLFLYFFTDRRKLGIAMGATSVAYWLLCVSFLVPAFAASERYERMDLFGELGSTPIEMLTVMFRQPSLFLDRLLRRESIQFLLILLVPLALLPAFSWRWTIAAIPLLLPTLLLSNAQWLTVKFWHQAPILVVFFAAALMSIASPASIQNSRGWSKWFTGGSPASQAAISRASASALLVGAAWGHYFFGFSPLSKPFEELAASGLLSAPDPRLAVVERLRAEIPRSHSVLATERLAAHFTDYARLFTGGRMRRANWILLDRDDKWDASSLLEEAHSFAADPRYEKWAEFGGILVFRRLDNPAESELE